MLIKKIINMFFCCTYSDCLKASIFIECLRMCNVLWCANSFMHQFNKNVIDYYTHHMTILNLKCSYIRILLISEWFLEFCFVFNGGSKLLWYINLQRTLLSQNARRRERKKWKSTYFEQLLHFTITYLDGKYLQISQYYKVSHHIPSKVDTRNQSLFVFFVVM